MSKIGLQVSVALLAMCLTFTQAQAQQAQADTRAAQVSLVKQVKEHIDKAKAAAGKEWPWFQQMLCSNPQMGGDVIGMFFAAGRLSAPDADFEPVRTFDNLYYVGLTELGAWAVTTSQGIILIDSLNSEDTEPRLLPNMRKVGLDPAQIKIVIVTHAHGDHGGGAKYLQDKFGAKVVMSAQDWDGTAKGALGRNNAPRSDMVVADGDKVTLGDTSVTTVFTPGHTPGAISVIVPLKDGGTPHTAMMWGGPQWGFRNADVPAREFYEKSLVKYHQAVKQAGADVVLESHPFLSNLVVKLAGMRNRKAGEPNPMIVGTDGVDRYMTIWTECGRASMARYQQYLLKYGPNAREWPQPPFMDEELLK
jgi:metallo-beta-lactamase class B